MKRNQEFILPVLGVFGLAIEGLDKAIKDISALPRCSVYYGMDLWAYQRGVVLDFSRPGKPTDNAFIEAFNGRFRTECLNQHWFTTLADAAEKLEAWRRYYNEERPHVEIGNKAPITLTKSGGITSLSP